MSLINAMNNLKNPNIPVSKKLIDLAFEQSEDPISQAHIIQANVEKIPLVNKLNVDLFRLFKILKFSL